MRQQLANEEKAKEHNGNGKCAKSEYNLRLGCDYEGERQCPG